MFELWTSDGFEWFFAVNLVFPKFAVLARSKQLMPVTVKLRIDFLGLWSPRRFVVASFDVGPMIPCKATKQWRIVEIQLLATVSWTCGCQPFSCPCSLNAMHCRKEVYATCLSKGIHAFCEHQRIQFLPEAWGRYDGCIMLGKDRVEVSKIWITGHWLWSRLSYLRDCCKAMKNCRDSGFSLRGLEAGLWAFRLQMLATSVEICWTCLFKASILALPFWNSKHSLPTRSFRFLRAAVPSSSSALWFNHAHPFVAAAGKTCLMQRSRGFGHGVVVWEICYDTVIVLSVVPWQTSEQLSRLRF